MHAIGVVHAILGIGLELLMQPLRIELVKSLTRRPRARPVPSGKERMLGVVTEEPRQAARAMLDFLRA